MCDPSWPWIKGLPSHTGGRAPILLKGRCSGAVGGCRLRRNAVRVATVERNTKETQIRGRVELDGTGAAEIATGIGFLDHMLEQLAKHSLIDIELNAKGDLHIDFHHTTEDTGYVVGEAVSRALGGRRGWL